MKLKAAWKKVAGWIYMSEAKSVIFSVYRGKKRKARKHSLPPLEMICSPYSLASLPAKQLTLPRAFTP